MKKNIVYSLLVMIILNVACKKDIDVPSYLRGKVDGIAFECNADIRATARGAADNSIFFRGDWPSYSIQFYLDGQGSDITQGTYNFQTGKIYQVNLFQNNVGYAAGYFCASFIPCSFFGSGRITILEINKKKIRGTFEFTTSVDGGTGLLKTVTDGDFSIKRD